MRPAVLNGALRRGFEISGALAGLVLTAPLLAAASVAIWRQDGWPVLYKQVRIGRDGKPFVLFKLRSMRSGTTGPSITAAGDARITPIGRWLRRYKLDELPQLWNVLIGDMSLVGPRPEAPAYVDPDSYEWREVLHTRPGITDLATLMYRNEELLLARADNPEAYYREQILPHKLKLNMAFQRRRTFWLEIKLIALTVRHSFWPSSFDAATIAPKFLPRDVA